MNAHLVIAHPQKNSFNFALHNTALNTLSGKNIHIEVTELYQQEFNAIAHFNDVLALPQSAQHNLAAAQRWAINTNNFSDDIKQEQEKLLAADILILQFPLWWWSYPAQLKGWIDRVFSSGFAYGEKAHLPAKKILYSVTTGGANTDEEHRYYQQKINALCQDVFGYIGWHILPAFIAHGVQQKTQHARALILTSYKQHVLNMINSKQ